MPDLPLLYGSTTNLFILGWLALATAVFLSTTSRARGLLLLFGGRVVPLVLFAAFAVSWIATRGMPGDITSFDGLLVAHSVPERVLTGWYELLGLALLIARWIVDSASDAGQPRLVVLTSLIAAFVAAAFGVLWHLAAGALWRQFQPRN